MGILAKSWIRHFLLCLGAVLQHVLVGKLHGGAIATTCAPAVLWIRGALDDLAHREVLEAPVELCSRPHCHISGKCPATAACALVPGLFHSLQMLPTHHLRHRMCTHLHCGELRGNSAFLEGAATAGAHLTFETAEPGQLCLSPVRKFIHLCLPGIRLPVLLHHLRSCGLEQGLALNEFGGARNIFAVVPSHELLESHGLIVEATRAQVSRSEDGACAPKLGHDQQQPHLRLQHPRICKAAQLQLGRPRVSSLPRMIRLWLEPP
mmetsp:Transcript_43194/g.92170  ORF Transcript_43194/g.92170 Transcript_43194/m.92170 type:complete len:264 (+) Transcript_43194:716-1507(+)